MLTTYIAVATDASLKLNLHKAISALSQICQIGSKNLPLQAEDPLQNISFCVMLEWWWGATLDLVSPLSHPLGNDLNVIGRLILVKDN